MLTRIVPGGSDPDRNAAVMAARAERGRPFLSLNGLLVLAPSLEAEVFVALTSLSLSTAGIDQAESKTPMDPSSTDSDPVMDPVTESASKVGGCGGAGR